MPWVVATLFLSVVWLAYAHRALFTQPLASSFGALLWLKITLALSVGCHFVYALKTASDGCMTSRKFKLLHLSVGSHMIGIVVLAKGMFYVTWCVTSGQKGLRAVGKSGLAIALVPHRSSSLLDSLSLSARRPRRR